jgi:signal transduction histidine kinase
MLAEIVISIALATFVCVSITNPLKKILSNTISLSKGTALSPPIKGHDEIAELDQFLFKSATEVRELERFKRDMIGIVSQELKSPPFLVGTFLSSVSAGVYGSLAEKATQRVERTCTSVKRLIGLIADLLLLDRLDLEISPTEISVDDLLAASVDTVKELSERSGIEIVVKSEGGTAFADRDRLIQVIVNLLSNALKFSPPKGQITIEAGQRDGWFECRISDQGRGIPEAFRIQIFEPFKQVDAKDATAKKGTGLGLTISRSIVEQHGGVIGVDSEEGKGSTFWYKIPASKSSFSNQGANRNLLDQPGKTSSLQTIKTQEIVKFSVLKQGMVIISVPLIFQLAFVFCRRRYVGANPPAQLSRGKFPESPGRTKYDGR